MTAPQDRFTDRAADYAKYRPRYPAGLIDLLKKEIGLTADWVIADIGAGTGISSIPFIEHGNAVYLIEPNADMRAVARAQLDLPAEQLIDGSAEHTGLREQSVDLVFCAQAFHWFDLTEAKREFARILQPDGHIVLAWNDRDLSDPFQKAYEQILLSTLPDYRSNQFPRIDLDQIATFFAPVKASPHFMPNQQGLDLDGLLGRLRSSSYCPKEGPLYASVADQVTSLFHSMAVDGHIQFAYQTEIHIC